MLLIITSTSDELFSSVIVYDLALLKYGVMVFFCNFWLWPTLQE